MARQINSAKNEKRAAKPQRAGIMPINPVLKRSLFIITIYLIFGLSWIFITDSINFTRLTEISSMAMVSSIKGSLYVVLTAGLIFALVYPAFKKISADQNHLAQSYAALQKERENLLYSENKLREDITRRKELEMTLNEHIRSRTVLLDNLQGMAFRCRNNEARTIQYVSQGCFSLTGYRQESIMNGDISYCDMIVPKYHRDLRKKWDEAMASRTRFKEEYEIITAAGQVKWVLEQGEGVLDENGNTVAMEGLIIDITKQKEQELMFKYFSEHDFNTGLANRRYFKDFVSRELQQMQLFADHAVILVHINKLNLINMTHGFIYSEQLVRELSIVLSRLCASNCSLFQIAVDRFLFYVKEYGDRRELISICESILNIFEQRMNRLYVQIGIIEINGDIKDADCLLKYASIAAASSGKDRYSFFNKDMEAMLQRRETIIGELTGEACSERTDKLFIEYQPIVEATTGNISGFEALARFRSAKYGLVPPTEFIAVAEEEQLIIPLGKKILLQVFDFMRTLQDSGNGALCMSVNLSAIQLLNDDFIPDLKKIIRENAVTPQNLIVEITESVFTNDFDEINLKLESLSAMGIRVAIDDFGTGYSSLARERELNVNCLKIDKYFIDKLGENDERTITSDIISMAHKLGHCVVAEGVENEVQKQYLVAHQCDFMQGYLYSRPLPRHQALLALQKTEVHHGGL